MVHHVFGRIILEHDVHILIDISDVHNIIINFTLT